MKVSDKIESFITVVIVLIFIFLLSSCSVLLNESEIKAETIESLTRQNEKLIYSNSELANQLNEMIKERSK